MKKVLSFVIILSFYLNCNSENILISNDNIGSIKSHKESTKQTNKQKFKSIYNGIEKDYYDNGNLKSLITYKNGTIDGNCKRYYENGELMIDKICHEDNTVVLKYGFFDGRYVKHDKVNGLDSYKVFSKTGDLIYTAIDDFMIFDDSTKLNCNSSVEIVYPIDLIKNELEGIVIVKLRIDSSGKLNEIIPMYGFHEEAVEQITDSLKKIECFNIRYKDGQSIEYEMTFIGKYEIN